MFSLQVAGKLGFPSQQENTCISRTSVSTLGYNFNDSQKHIQPRGFYQSFFCVMRVNVRYDNAKFLERWVIISVLHAYNVMQVKFFDIRLRNAQHDRRALSTLHIVLQKLPCIFSNKSFVPLQLIMLSYNRDGPIKQAICNVSHLAQKCAYWASYREQ